MQAQQASLVPILHEQGSPLLPRQIKEKKTLRNKLSHVGAFAVANTIGDGICGKVKQASLNNSDVAVKMIKKEQVPFTQIQREVSLQAKCHDHDNIATCFDFLESKERLFVVMELAQCDLFDFVQQSPQPLEESVIQQITHQLVSAVAHMHSKGVCHRDIKPENILVCGKNSVSLTDFGYALEWTPQDDQLSASAGTVRCLPPEMFLHDEESGTRKYNPQKVDVWGIGVALFYLLTARFPFDLPTPMETATAIVRGHLTNALPESVSPEARDFVNLVLVGAEVRPSAQALLQHPFIHQLSPSCSV